MPKRNIVPADLASFLPKGDRQATAEELADGRWIVAGRHAVIVVGERGVEDSGMWHEIQFAAWDADSRVLRVVWVDPARTEIAVKTQAKDPGALMVEVSEKVNHALVVQRVVEASNGTRLTASIRRREDGELFSTLVADGPLDAEGKRQGDLLEAMVRDGVGLY